MIRCKHITKQKYISIYNKKKRKRKKEKKRKKKRKEKTKKKDTKRRKRKDACLGDQIRLRDSMARIPVVRTPMVVVE